MMCTLKPTESRLPSIRTAAATCILLAIMPAVPARQAFAETPVDTDSLLEVYAEHLSQHRSLSAAFTQRRYLAMFDRPLVSKGTVGFVHPDRFLLHYKEPFEAVILLKDGELKRYRVVDGTYKKQPSLEIVTKAITGEMMRWLSAEFTDDFPYEVEVAPNDARHLILTPKNPAARAIFSHMELFFPDNPEYLKKIKLVEENGDSIVVEHEQPSFAPLDDSAFAVPGKE